MWADSLPWYWRENSWDCGKPENVSPAKRRLSHLAPAHCCLLGTWTQSRQILSIFVLFYFFKRSYCVNVGSANHNLQANSSQYLFWSSFIGISPLPFVYRMSVTVFRLQQQSWVLATETEIERPSEPNTYATRPFTVSRPLGPVNTQMGCIPPPGLQLAILTLQRLIQSHATAHPSSCFWLSIAVVGHYLDHRFSNLNLNAEFYSGLVKTRTAHPHLQIP